MLASRKAGINEMPEAGRAPQGAMLTFWGVRRGIAAPGAATAVFGGNSLCAAIEFPGEFPGGRGARRPVRHVAILDGGTGLRPLGAHLAAGGPVACDLLFSRPGFDRICGLPFFAAAFDAANRIAFHGARQSGAGGAGGIRTVLTRLMADPVFPVPIAMFQASARFHDLAPGAKAALFAARTAAALPLAGASTAWRLEVAGQTLVYAAAPAPQDSARLAAFARGCDLLVLGAAGERGDAFAASVARRAGAAMTVVTGHAPEEDDAQLRRRDRTLQRRPPPTRLAREGMTIPLTAR